MTTSPDPYRGIRYPAEVIQHAVWLYRLFRLSLQDVELILAAREVVVSDETVREWGLRFGQHPQLVSSRQRCRRSTPVMVSIPPLSFASPLRASLRSANIIPQRRRPSADGCPEPGTSQVADGSRGRSYVAKRAR
jgi:hypothetical protein